MQQPKKKVKKQRWKILRFILTKSQHFFTRIRIVKVCHLIYKPNLKEFSFSSFVIIPHPTAKTEWFATHHGVRGINFLAHHPRDSGVQSNGHTCCPIHVCFTRSSKQLAYSTILILNLNTQDKKAITLTVFIMIWKIYQSDHPIILKLFGLFTSYQS